MSLVDAELKQFGSQIIIIGGNIGKDRHSHQDDGISRVRTPQIEPTGLEDA